MPIAVRRFIFVGESWWVVTNWGRLLLEWLYHLLNLFLSPYLASLVFALLLVGGCWWVAHLLYKRKIYIKL